MNGTNFEMTADIRHSTVHAGNEKTFKTLAMWDGDSDYTINVSRHIYSAMPKHLRNTMGWDTMAVVAIAKQPHPHPHSPTARRFERSGKFLPSRTHVYLAGPPQYTTPGVEKKRIQLDRAYQRGQIWRNLRR